MLTEASIGKFFHTFDGTRVTVLTKHPRKAFFEVREHDCAPSYWVTENGDYDLTGQGKPDKRDLISPTSGQLFITFGSHEEIEIIPDREDPDKYYFEYFGKNFTVSKSTMKLFDYSEGKIIGTARLP